MKRGNLFEGIPDDLPGEFLEEITRGEGSLRIERIVSRRHSSPEDFWYDQDSNEWVAVLAGSAVICFEAGDGAVSLGPGDWVEIGAHVRHRVDSTSSLEDTIWLAIHWE